MIRAFQFATIIIVLAISGCGTEPLSPPKAPPVFKPLPSARDIPAGIPFVEFDRDGKAVYAVAVVEPELDGAETEGALGFGTEARKAFLRGAGCAKEADPATEAAERFVVFFYAERDAADRLSVIPRVVALYSTGADSPPGFPPAAVSGPWKDRAKLFESMGRDFRKRALKPQSLRRGIPALVLPLRGDAPLPVKWETGAGGGEQSSPIEFEFPSPFGADSGVAKRAHARLDLGAGGVLSLALFSVEVACKDVTTGDDALDESVRYLLDLESNPTATFVMDGFEGNPPRLEGVGSALVAGHGQLAMAGHKSTVRFVGWALPSEDEFGKPRIDLYGWFETRLKKPFNILGPVGEKPASDLLLFSVHLAMTPAQ